MLNVVAQNSGMGTLIIMLPVMFLIFWAMSRPQKKRDAERKAILSALKKGDKVVTIGGIHGEIKNLSERFVTIVVDNKGTELKMSRAAISGKEDNSAQTA